MSGLYATLLGIVQGLTEFLPVSSSAHLILARALFGWDVEQFGLAFDVACHLGTVAAVAVYFRRELGGALAAVPRVFDRTVDPGVRLLWLMGAGTAPVAVVGMSLGSVIEQRLRTPPVAGAMLAAGAVVFLLAERLGRRARGEESLTVVEATALGVAQSTALVPGVSRSGIMIAAAMFLGLRRDAAARVAFIVGVPAILAAGAREAMELAREGMTATELQLFGLGAGVSALVGYMTIRCFVRYLAGHSLAVFAGYRLALAGVVFAWRAW